MPITASPTIVIPGITASVLHDEYELPPEAVWTAVRTKRYDRITLHPEDHRYELLEPARVSSGGPFPFIYEDLTEELRDGLAGEEDEPAPVFPFGYDWRLATGDGASGEAARNESSGDVLRDDDWLAVAGADAETRVALRVGRDDEGRPRFLLSSDERRNDWESEDQGARRNTGDGTVPLAGAVPPFMDESRIVCVTPGDLDYWELRDRGLSKLAGFHGLVPKMNMLHRLAIRFLLGASDPHGNTWGRRLPGVEEWRPPLELREKE